MLQETESFCLSDLQTSGAMPWNLYEADTLKVGNFSMVPLPSCNPDVLALLKEDKALGRGGFASVFDRDTLTVFKVTACALTHALYALQLSEAHAIEGLPVVHACLGDVGVSPDGELVAKAYIVERCWPAESDEELAKVDALIDCLSDRSPLWLSAEQQDPLCHAKAFSDAAELFPECAEALNWLARFVRESGVAMGDLKHDNVMVTKSGGLALVDLLSELCYDPNWEEALARAAEYA